MPWLGALFSGLGSALGSAGSAAGSALSSAGSSAASAIGSAGSAAGNALAGSAGSSAPSLAAGGVGPAAPATSGLLGSGGSFGAGGALQNAMGIGEQGHIASLGQQVPSGIEYVGPSDALSAPEAGTMLGDKPFTATGGMNFGAQGGPGGGGGGGGLFSSGGIPGLDSVSKGVGKADLVLQLLQSLGLGGGGGGGGDMALPPMQPPMLPDVQVPQAPPPPLSLMRAYQMQM